MEAPSLWYAALAGLFGVGCGIIAFLIMYRGHVLSMKAHRDYEKWLFDVRELAIACIDTDAAAAEAKRQLVVAVGELPLDFNPTAFLAVDITAGIQRATMFEAEKRGLVQVGTFERIYQVPLSAVSTPPPEPEGGGAPVQIPPSPVPTDVHDLGEYLGREGEQPTSDEDAK